RQFFVAVHESAYGPKADIAAVPNDVRFSNRPVRVKRFRPSTTNVARGLALLFGIGNEALPSWDSRIRWNDLWGGLAAIVGRSKRTCELTSSIVPRGTPYHRLVELEVSSYRI